MVAVTELGYRSLGISVLATWSDFAGRIPGLEVDDGDDDRSFHHTALHAPRLARLQYRVRDQG